MPKHIRSRVAIAVPVAAGSAFIAVGLAMSSVGGAPSTIVFGVLALLLGTWVVWRAARGGVSVSTEGVRVRGEWRTRFVPWDEVVEFFVGSNWSFIPWSRLYVLTTEQETIVAPYVASIGPLGPRLGDLAEELNALRPAPS